MRPFVVQRLLNPLIVAIFHHYKDDVHTAQRLSRFSLPVPPSVSLEPVKIPLRQDLDLEGMSQAQKSGTLDAEWIQYKGWGSSSISPGSPDRILLYANGGAYFICGPGSHRGMLSTLSQHSGARILCKSKLMP